MSSSQRTAILELAQALQSTRARTLGLMAAWHEALPNLSVAPQPGMNPPLWEWGHVAWFQEWWTVRNAQRYAGTHSASNGPTFGASLVPDADALFNSSEVTHDSRWSLALPNWSGTQRYLAEVLAHSLAHLQQAPDASDASLYFWRLVLKHEAMHNEASVYMAQALGVELPVSVRQRPGHVANRLQHTVLRVPSRTVTLGHTGAGFAFDNEYPAHSVQVPSFDIDAQPVTWARYLPFLQDTGHACPPHVRHAQGLWEVERFGAWATLEAHDPVVHINAHDAQAWCAWAGRRLPTEAEWVGASQALGFAWGQVWEWTASDFAPFAGFESHPYRDYSEPWWHNHRVLKGACAATSQLVMDPMYRNFFTPERRDIFAGFRSVAL